MKRTSKNELQAICDRINIITDSPLSPYTKGENGITVNLGNYHLSGAYGGWALCRMQTQGGGVSDIFGGHVPKKELAARMHAFIHGIELKSKAI
jgi:hypothetical protein